MLLELGAAEHAAGDSGDRHLRAGATLLDERSGSAPAWRSSWSPRWPSSARWREAAGGRPRAALADLGGADRELALPLDGARWPTACGWTRASGGDEPRARCAELAATLPGDDAGRAPWSLAMAAMMTPADSAAEHAARRRAADRSAADDGGARLRPDTGIVSNLIRAGPARRGATP